MHTDHNAVYFVHDRVIFSEVSRRIYNDVGAKRRKISRQVLYSLLITSARNDCDDAVRKLLEKWATNAELEAKEYEYEKRLLHG